MIVARVLLLLCFQCILGAITVSLPVTDSAPCTNNTCECHSNSYVITCSNHQLTVVPYFSATFKTAWRDLRMDGNNLQRINPGAFTNLTAIEVLFLSENKLERLSPGDFAGLDSIREILLNKNLITHIDPGTFSDVQSTLVEINLSNNLLITVANGVFSGMRNLYSLNLGNNRIEYIESKAAFQDMGNLHDLDFTANSIRSCAIVHAPFDYLKVLNNLKLNENEFTQIRGTMFAGLGSELTSTMLRIDMSRNGITFIDALFPSEKFELDLEGNNLTTIHSWISLVRERMLRNTSDSLPVVSERKVILTGNLHVSCNLMSIINDLFTSVTVTNNWACQAGGDSTSDVLLMESVPLAYCGTERLLGNFRILVALVLVGALNHLL